MLMCPRMSLSVCIYHLLSHKSKLSQLECKLISTFWVTGGDYGPVQRERGSLSRRTAHSASIVVWAAGGHQMHGLLALVTSVSLL